MIKSEAKSGSSLT